MEIDRLVKSLFLSALFGLVIAPGAHAQGTQLVPPGFKWGAQGAQTPAPTQQIGYDSETGLPCIIGSTATCKLAVSTGSATVVTDPCQANAKTSIAISQTANTKLFSQVSAKKNYLCSIMLVGADAENVSLVEGTGSTCGTATAAIIGGTTAANGPNLAANGGFSLGSGVATIAAGANNNFDVCLFQSGSGRAAGVLTYVQQ